MEQVPCSGSTNVMCHDRKFCQRGDLVPKICAPLLQASPNWHLQIKRTHVQD